MKDQGGHGGASADETTVPFITVGLPCSSEEKYVFDPYFLLMCKLKTDMDYQLND